MTIFLLYHTNQKKTALEFRTAFNIWYLALEKDLDPST